MSISARSYLLTAALVVASSQASAFDFMKDSDLVFQGGGFIQRAGEDQNIDIDGLVGNHYNVDANKASAPFLGLGYYLHAINNDTFALDYGINVFYLFATKVDGTILVEQQFEDLSYKYFVESLPLYAALKTNFKNKTNTCAFTMDVGIGPNFMTTRDYKETILVAGAVADDTFSGETVTTFSATAGLGIRFYQLMGPLDFEIGYRFFYLGAGSLSKENHLMQDDLSTGDVYANAIVFALTL